MSDPMMRMRYEYMVIQHVDPWEMARALNEASRERYVPVYYQQYGEVGTRIILRRPTPVEERATGTMVPPAVQKGQ